MRQCRDEMRMQFTAKRLHQMHCSMIHASDCQDILRIRNCNDVLHSMFRKVDGKPLLCPFHDRCGFNLTFNSMTRQKTVRERLDGIMILLYGPVDFSWRAFVFLKCHLTFKFTYSLKIAIGTVEARGSREVTFLYGFYRIKEFCGKSNLVLHTRFEAHRRIIIKVVIG